MAARESETNPKDERTKSLTICPLLASPASHRGKVPNQASESPTITAETARSMDVFLMIDMTWALGVPWYDRDQTLPHRNGPENSNPGLGMGARASPNVHPQAYASTCRDRSLTMLARSFTYRLPPDLSRSAHTPRQLRWSADAGT